MRLNDQFNNVFSNTPILGMIHLAGDNPVKRALEEIAIYEEEGVDGAIIENYHGSAQDVAMTLRETRKSKIIIGVNLLPNEFYHSIPLAHEYGAKFVQLDHVAGSYTRGEIDVRAYQKVKDEHPNIIVLGGVWPKYYQPVKGSDLADDLKMGTQRAEAIVVTGAGTGMQTPIEKIMEFRKIIGCHTLIVGAGLTPDNAYEQLVIADGAIVGSTFKAHGITDNVVDKHLVRTFMTVVKEVRAYKSAPN